MRGIMRHGPRFSDTVMLLAQIMLHLSWNSTGHHNDANCKNRPEADTGMTQAVDVLIFAMEAGRYGPARLPQTLESAGLRVAALCPLDNVLSHTDHVSATYRLPSTRSGARLVRRLAAVVGECRPALVIPGDEQAVALLHHAIWENGDNGIDQTLRSLLLDSLGPADRLGAMLFKHETLALARRIGLAVPDGVLVGNAEDAVRAAERLTYPVFVKESFGWAGQGVYPCADSAAVVRAFVALEPSKSAVKAALRHAMGRDWYPAAQGITVQAGVAGRPAFYCALAWEGRMVGGFAGQPLRTAGPTGPSCEVRIGAHAAMANASERLIEALGCTGFIGFDFILPEGDLTATGVPVLIECNPRPIQTCHLGYRVGVDLVQALADLLRGGAVPDVPLEARSSLDVLLFPHACDAADLREGVVADVPMTDAGLMAYAARLALPPCDADCDLGLGADRKGGLRAA